MRRIAVGFITVCLLAISARATIIHVPSQYSTIQAGINASVNGDTISVATGTYPEHINFMGKAILLESEIGPQFTAIQKAVDGNPIVLFQTAESPNSVLSGFTIKNSTSTGIKCTASSPTIQNCIIENNTSFNQIGFLGGGITVESNSNPVIRKNIIRHNSTNSGSLGGGIFIHDSQAKVDSNLIYSNSSVQGGGIDIHGGSADILGNIFYDNQASNAGSGILIVADSVNIINNTFYYNRGNNVAGGIWAGNCSDLVIKNNIISSNDGYGIYFVNPIRNHLLYNCLYANVGGDIFGITPEAGNIFSNPQFEGPQFYNYSLLATSPCIDAGDPSSPYDPDGTIADMGAIFFYQGANAWYVSTTGDDNTGDGSESNPFRTIQRGIDEASNGDSVLIMPGTYVGVGNRNISTQGKAILVKGLYGHDSTIIDVQNSGNNGFSMEDSNEDSLTTISGFSIQNAQYGIMLHGSSPWIDRIEIINCTVGIQLWSSQNCAVTNSEFSHNGTAIFEDSWYAGSNRIENSIFRGNTLGVGTLFMAGFMRLDSCSFDSNQTALDGGFAANNIIIKNGINGILGHTNTYWGTSNNIQNCILENLSGIVFNPGQYDEIKNSIMRNNSGSLATFIYSGDYPGRLLIDSCQIYNNTGPGITMRFCDFDLQNTSYYNNHGAINLMGDDVSKNVINCSIVNNDSGIVISHPYGFETTEIRNNIIINNSSTGITFSGLTDGLTIECNDVFANSGDNYSGIPDQTGLNGNISADPMFCFPDSGNYYISSGSPCAPGNNSCNQLMGAFPVGCPAAPSIPPILAPANGSAADSSTYLVWLLSTDPDSFDVVTYSIQVDEDTAFASPEIDQSGLQTGMIVDDAFAIQLGGLDEFENLQIDTRYYWRVRAEDNNGLSSSWTDGSNYFIFMPQNSAPFAPDSGFSPANYEEVISLTPTITWNPAADSDPDDNASNLHYILHLFADTSMGQGYSYYDTTAPGINQITVADTLPDNFLFIYHVMTVDDEGLESSWSQIQRFWTNHYNFPPEPFPLYSPADDFKLALHSLSFSWGNSSDNDPLSSLSYYLQFSPDSLFDNIFVTLDNIPDTLIGMDTEFLENFGNNLHWRVLAIDNDSLIRIGGIPEPEYRHLMILPPGDANANGILNGLDVTFLINYLKGIGPTPDPLLAADANGSCSVNGLDVTYLVNYLKGIGPAPLRGICETIVLKGEAKGDWE